ncbi:MAG: 16S rRNA (guanine(966)-N(2))-methyltransferase RsmD [Paracoccaceae bacterium]
MRIIGGRLKGLGLTPVGKGDKGAHLRPTTDRVRESLFNLLMGGRFGDPISDAIVLDLFAGTGALGLEALSRGAAHVTFVDSGRAAGKLLAANIAKAQAGDVTTVVSRDATRSALALAHPATLVFLDPPYGAELGAKALAANDAAIAQEAMIVWEDSSEQLPPAGFQRLEARRYGDTWLTFLQKVHG